MILIYVIIGVTVLVSYRAFEDRSLFNKLLFNAYAVTKQKQYHRVLSHILVHSDWGHLFFNMLSFYFFADAVFYFLNAYIGMGVFWFLVLYVTGGMAASIPALLKHKDHTWYNSVGASGAVSAVIFAAIFFDPWNPIMLMLIPIPIPGFLFGIIYIFASSYFDKKSNDNVAHDAHIAGSLYGFLFPLLVKPELYKVFLDQILPN